MHNHDYENTHAVLLDAINDGYEKIHETNVPTDVVDGVTDCEQTQEDEPRSPLPVDTVSDTTSDPNYKRAQEEKLSDVTCSVNS